MKQRIKNLFVVLSYMAIFTLMLTVNFNQVVFSRNYTTNYSLTNYELIITSNDDKKLEEYKDAFSDSELPGWGF